MNIGMAGDINCKLLHSGTVDYHNTTNGNREHVQDESSGIFHKAREKNCLWNFRSNKIVVVLQSILTLEVASPVNFSPIVNNCKQDTIGIISASLF